MVFDVLGYAIAVGAIVWTARFLRRVRRGQEAGPPVDPAKHDLHGHY